MSLEPVEFWHQNLGRFLSSAPAAESAMALVPTRMKRGTDLNRLGAGIAAYYIATPGHAWLIGKIDLPNTAELTVIPTDDENPVSGEQRIAEWLVSEKMTTPFMIGMIGNANPNASFKISHTALRAVFCQSGKSIPFSVDAVRKATVLFSEHSLSWWKVVAPAIRQYAALKDARRTASEAVIEREKQKLSKMLAAVPALTKLLPEVDIKPGSGEYQILSWFYRKET